MPRVRVHQNRDEKTRKERKARWIRVKNLMREYPECAYDGDFYCNHIYDPASPWIWVDFRFFHTKQKKYYAVAMVTAEYEAYQKAEDLAWKEAYEAFPQEEKCLLKIGDDWNIIINTPKTETELKRDSLNDVLFNKYSNIPVLINPSIKLLDYGPVATGLFATVNKPYIDEHVIREFIAFFRELGEPTSPGWTWEGEGIQVDPQRIINRT